MLKKELTVRERRKIYEDTIYVVAQAQKIGAKSPVASKERAVQNLIEKQTSRCVTILTTVLGYHESILADENGTKRTMLLPEDNNPEYAIEKSKFEEVVLRLPENKELREALWRSFVKRDKASTEKLNVLVA